MSRRERWFDHFTRLRIDFERNHARMRSVFERDAMERFPGPIDFMLDGWMQIAARNFDTWLMYELNNLSDYAWQLVDNEDRRLRVERLAGSELEELFARYQTEREYRRLPRQALSSEGFENYVIEILGDRPHSTKRILEGETVGSNKRHRL